VVGYFPPTCLLSRSYVRHRVDFTTITCAELQNFDIPFNFTAEKTGTSQLHAAFG
jgi:hypothetical protein